MHLLRFLRLARLQGFVQGWGSTALSLLTLERLAAVALHLGFGSVAISFLIGRVDAGYASAVLSPWVVQCTALFFLLAVAAVLLRRPLLASAAVGCAAWGGTLAAPTLLPHDADPVRVAALAGRPQVRVLFTNICNRNEPSAEATEWIRSESPDLLGVAELTDAWRDALEPLKERLPYAAVWPQTPDACGIALYSRYPIIEASIGHIIPDAAVHIEALVDYPEGVLRVFVIHPPSPRSAERTEIRDASIEAYAARCNASSVPTILMGDFNETPFGVSFRSFLETTGYHQARDAAGFSPSWPTTFAGLPVPAALRISIDHVVASDHFVARSCRVGRNIHSDHLPIVADLVLAPNEVPISLVQAGRVR